jgi:membrane-associated phospholipid phosphatase
LIERGDRFRAPPPPAWASPSFAQALSEVRRLSDQRTREHDRIAALWADGTGSYTPAGRWNKIGADLVVKHRLGEPYAARAFALLDMALMDAGIACWDSKFHYWVIRPSQVDPAIVTPVGLPAFPSYPSAHAAFSGAGAGLLGLLFPAEQRFLEAKAEEAARSRIYGGLHYPFDASAGLEQGRQIGRLAFARGHRDGAG